MDSPTRRDRRWGASTRAIRGASDDAGPAPAGSPLALPLVQSTVFSFESPEEMIEVFEGGRPGFVYSRYGNPTVRVVEKKIASLEGGDFACLFASGMAAIHAALWCVLPKDGLLLTSRDLYGGTIELIQKLLPRIGVTWRQVDLAREGDIADALKDRPAAILFETPTNPLVRLVDGRQLVGRAREVGARVIVDNTFATPVLQNPLEWGADIVVHSATKYLGGHSDLTLGVVVGREQDKTVFETTRRSLGASPDPFAAWLLNRGLMTLAVRIRAQCESAMTIARSLEHHPRIRRVHYPGIESHPGHEIAATQMGGFGGILAIDLGGGRETAISFMRGLRLIRLGASLGGVETLATHPATSSHRMLKPEERGALGIGDGLIRFSVGLEDVEDLKADIESALEATGQPAA